MYLQTKYKTLLCNLYPPVDENLNVVDFALEMVAIILCQLQKKVSKASGN